MRYVVKQLGEPLLRLAQTQFHPPINCEGIFSWRYLLQDLYSWLISPAFCTAVA